METTKLSSKGQVVIPKSLRSMHRWDTGLEFMVIDTGDGLLLKPRGPFTPTELSEVAGMLKDKIAARSDKEIEASLREEVRRQWRGRD